MPPAILLREEYIYIDRSNAHFHGVLEEWLCRWRVSGRCFWRSGLRLITAPSFRERGCWVAWKGPMSSSLQGLPAWMGLGMEIGGRGQSAWPGGGYIFRPGHMAPPEVPGRRRFIREAGKQCCEYLWRPMRRMASWRAWPSPDSHPQTLPPNATQTHC